MKTNQRVLLTKKLLKDGLVSLLKTETIDHISVKALCENAGINRSTFYKHYGSQYDLLNEIIDDALQLIKECNISIQDKTEEPISPIYNVIQYLYTHREIAQLVILNPGQGKNFYEYVRPILFDDLIPVFRSKGIPNNQTEYILLFLLGGTQSLIHQWVSLNMRESPEEITNLLLTMCTNMISSFI